MKTKTYFKRPIMFKTFLVIPLVVLLVFTLSSCGKSKSSELIQSEIAPPPPIPEPSKSDSVFKVVDIMPFLQGGDAALLKYIADSTKYPEESKTKGIQGKVIVQFVVDATGSAGNAKIIQGADPLLDEAALKVIQKLPKFEPGIKDGKAVSVYYTVPINFTLL